MVLNGPSLNNMLAIYVMIGIHAAGLVNQSLLWRPFTFSGLVLLQASVIESNLKSHLQRYC